MGRIIKVGICSAKCELSYDKLEIIPPYYRLSLYKRLADCCFRLFAQWTMLVASCDDCPCSSTRHLIESDIASMMRSKALTNSQIVRAALIVLLGFLASGVLGFVRTLILSAQFGAGEALDAFLAAQRIPETIFVLVAGGALGSSFIPVFARLRERDDDEHSAWQLASATMTLTAFAAAVLGVIVIIAAPTLVTNFLMPDSPPDVQQLTASLTQWMMITPVIFAISGLIMGILQAHQLFLLPSLAISMNSIGLIIGALVIAPLLPTAPITDLHNRMFVAQMATGLPAIQISSVAQVQNANVYGLAIGAILSALLHLVVQLPGLWRIRARLRVLPSFRVEGVVEVLRLMGPRVLGLAVVQVNFMVNIFFTSGMEAGSLTALTTAFILMFFVLGIIGQSIGSAVFPSLSALAAEKDMDGFKERLAGAMRGVLFLSFPATVILIVLGEPIVSLLERDAWTSQATAATAWAMGFYALGIAGFTLLEVLSRAFYALEDTWTPVRIGIAAMVSNIILSIVFIQVIGEPGNVARGPFAGLALANAVTTLVEAGALWWLLRRRIGTDGAVTGLNDRHILKGAVKALAASLVMGVAIVISTAVLSDMRGLMQAVIGAGIGGIVFFGLSFALGLEEARAVPMMVLRRVRR